MSVCTMERLRGGRETYLDSDETDPFLKSAHTEF